MSEYVTIELEFDDAPDTVDIYINQRLTSEPIEIYDSPSEGELGSPIAQMLFTAVEGIKSLKIREDSLSIERMPDSPWEALIDEVRDALRDWYL